MSVFAVSRSSYTIARNEPESGITFNFHGSGAVGLAETFKAMMISLPRYIARSGGMEWMRYTRYMITVHQGYNSDTLSTCQALPPEPLTERPRKEDYVVADPS